MIDGYHENGMIPERLLHSQDSIVLCPLDVHLDGGHGFTVQDMIDRIDIQYVCTVCTCKAVFGITYLEANLSLFLMDADIHALHTWQHFGIFHQHLVVLAARFDGNNFLVLIACIVNKASQGISVIRPQIEEDIRAVPQNRNFVFWRKILIFLFHPRKELQISADSIVYQILQHVTRLFIGKETPCLI